jgi:hypothetical protein
MSNVTPIGGAAGAGEPAAKARPCRRFHLAEPDAGPGNIRLIQALHGVCGAMEQLAEDSDRDVSIGLGTAAEILSAMLKGRVESD